MKVKVQDLIDFGIPRACYCRTPLSLEAEDSALIATGLKNGFDDTIVKKFIEYFGKNKVNMSLEKYSGGFYPATLQRLKKVINGYDD